MRIVRKVVEHGYAVKDPETGMFVDSERELRSLNEAEQFRTKQDAENYRDMVAFRRDIPNLEVVKIRVTTEEV